VAALEHWPRDGVPDKPGAWLMATAKRRAIDRGRQRRLHAEKHLQIAQELEAAADEQTTTQTEDADDFGDPLLRLLFIACHPLLPMDARLALTLKLLGGLATDEIARAFLVPEATLAQRIVRAKRLLAQARLPFEPPSPPERGERIESVLAVLYLIFNEGYSASAGDDLLRPALCQEAMRLARILVALLPGHAESHGLLALMELQASRLRARTDARGQPILLAEQDRSRWDHLLVRRGLESLERARRLGGEGGSYALQAAIAACHARAARHEDTDWPAIATLYGQLAALTGSPVVELNRIVAVSMAEGADAAWPLLQALESDARLRDYHLLPAVRGDLLERMDHRAEAAAAFRAAAAMTRNARERDVLLARAARCD
jgi:predicted RNA polymerase sigma factor